MGEQSLKIKNRINVLNKSIDYLIQASDDRYLKEHFLVGKGYDEDKVKHNLLIKYALCTTNCEIIDWVWYQINGVIPDKKQKVFDLNPKQVNIYNINKYVVEDSTWEEVQW